MDKKKKRWVIGAVILLFIVFAVFLQPSCQKSGQHR